MLIFSKQCDGFTAYKYHLAVKTHFEKKSYNAVEKNASVKTSEISFQARNDKALFSMIASNLKECHAVADFFIANYSAGNKEAVYDFDNAIKIYRAWLGRKQSRGSILKIELNYALQNGFSVYNRNTASKLIDMLTSGKVSLETFTLLYQRFDFTFLDGNFIWDEKYKLKVSKYVSFCKLTEKFSNIIDEVLHEYRTSLLGKNITHQAEEVQTKTRA